MVSSITFVFEADVETRTNINSSCLLYLITIEIKCIEASQSDNILEPCDMPVTQMTTNKVIAK